MTIVNSLYKMNKYQTPINKELIDSLPREVFSELTEYIDSVQFIKNIIAPEDIRGYAKDRPKHPDFNDGRIVVDLINPHILEDMDFFRERALFFDKNKTYTNIRPNPNPNSDYGRFWKEEVRRWKEGLVRPSDGEWIPGQLYFYWNYSPIWLVEDEKDTSSTSTKKKGRRVRAFPKPWLGDYLFYHYMEAARHNGKHGKLLKTRGVGFLEPNSSILKQLTGDIKVGDVKVGDMLLDRYGRETKVLEVYPQGKQDIYEVVTLDGRTIRCGKDHLWSVYDKSKGSANKNKLYTYKTKDLIEKGLAWKNKDGYNLYKFYIPELVGYVDYPEKKLDIPPYVMGALLGDGSMSTKSIKIASDDKEVIEKIQSDMGEKYTLVRDTSNNNYRIVYNDLYGISGNHIRINPLKKLLVDNGWNFTSSTKYIPEIYKLSSYEQRLELVKGLMDTDGSISKEGNLEFSNSNEQLVDDLASVLRSMGISCTKGLGRVPHQKEIKGKLYNIKQEYRLHIRTNLNLFNVSRKAARVKVKKLRNNNAIVEIRDLKYKEESTCFLVDNEEHLYLTGDFVPTHNSFKMGSISPCNMYTLPGSGNPNFHLASSKDFLTGDKGIWGKIVDVLGWIAETTPLPRMRLVNSDRDMTIKLGYKDEYGINKGLQSTVDAISLKDNPEKARGVRGPLIHYEEDGLFDNLEKAWNVNRKAVEDGDTAFGFMLAGGTGGCVTAGNKVWTNDGSLVNIEDLVHSEGILGFNEKEGKVSKENITYWQEPKFKECLLITTNTGKQIECSTDHPLYIDNLKGKFVAAEDVVIGDRIGIIDKVDIFGNNKMKYPRMIGLLIGDGSYGYNQSVRFYNCDEGISNYVESNFDYVINHQRSTKDNKIYKEYGIRNFRQYLRDVGIVDQVKNEKTLPVNIHSYIKEDICELLGGLYDADGYINIRNTSRGSILAEISLSSMSVSLMKEVQLLLIKLGIHSKIRERKPRLDKKSGIKDKNSWYELTIADSRSLVSFSENITLLAEHKQERLNKIKEVFKSIKPQCVRNGYRLEKITNIENVGIKQVYNLTADTTNTYLVNGIITHNTEGASFEGSEKLFYTPDAYNIYSVPNVYDKNTNGGSQCGFFWGCYLNRKDCYDLNTGEPDIIKALIQVLKDRLVVKYGASDPNAITQKKAEEPVTPQEAVMRTEGTVFPVADLKDHLETIMADREKFVSEHYVGDLIRTATGKIEFKPTTDKVPIRSYDKLPSDKTGAIEIFQMPRKNGAGEIPFGRYIAGIDPIDADSGNSLFSIIMMDTFTDKIVAVYSGRPRLASDAYEISLRMLEFYNGIANYEKNLKGLFTYFDQKRALKHLCDTPQILKDMDMIKDLGYGNTSKGTVANKEINKWGRVLQAEWQKKFSDGLDSQSLTNDEGEIRMLNLHSLRDIAYIEECIKWNADGNFDRVSAGSMLFILREDRYRRTESLKENDGNTGSDIANDKFFNKNFKRNSNISIY